MIRTIARKGLSLRRRGARAARHAPEPRDNSSAAADRPAEPAPPLDRRAIAVLPFANLSDDPEQEYFSEGISEDIITALSKLRWFYVIARNSSFIYKGKSVHLKQIGEELGVGYVVEGSVRKDGDQVRITAQLNDVVTGSQIWAERYDRNLADVFAVQDEITQAVVAAVEPQLYAAENFRARRKTPDNMDAWDLVMRALSHYWRVTRQDNLVAQALLEKAIAFDPGYGQALGLLAASHIFSAHMGWEEMHKAVPVAERAALAAIRADSEDAWAHYALASVYLFSRRFEDSLAEFELALRLNPNFSPARGYTAWRWPIAGAGRRATAPRGRRCDSRRAIPLPRSIAASPPIRSSSAAHYEEAIRLSREALRQRSDFVGAHRVLTAAAALAGQDDVAKAALRELRRAQPTISLAWIASRNAVPIRGRSRTLSERVPPRGPGLRKRTLTVSGGVPGPGPRRHFPRPRASAEFPPPAPDD